MKKKFKNQQGFTLLELVVVLSLFMLIMGVTVTMFISIVRHQKRILSQQEIISQISYVQDYFSRSLRGAVTDSAGSCLGQKGYVYLLTHLDVQTGFWQGIKFVSQDNVCHEFFLDKDGILKEIKNGAIAENLLSDKFKIIYGRFVINGDKNIWGATGNGAIRPRVSSAFNVQDLSYPDNPPLLLQTTVSQR